MNVILGTAFSLTLGIWRLRVQIAIEDVTLGDAPAAGTGCGPAAASSGCETVVARGFG
jgi:hypothetical protein